MVTLNTGEQLRQGRVVDADGRAIGAAQGIGDSKGVSGTVSAPGAAGALVTITNPGAGVYAVKVSMFVNAGSAGLVNAGLYHGATLVSLLVTSGIFWPHDIARVTVAAGEDIVVRAVAADAGAFLVSLVAQRIA